MRRKIKNTLIYLFLRTLLWGVACLPWRLALSLGAALGWLFQAAVPGERRRALASLASAFPELSAVERGRLARRTFAAMGRNALEFFKLHAYSARRITGLVEAVEGRQHMEAALARGRGVVCLTAHLGNWEILPILTNSLGWPSAVVAQRLYDPRLDALLNRFRERRGVRVIQRGRVTSEIIRCLRRNMLLGVLNDQDTDVDSRWAPFFGRPAKTPVGIFRLIRKTGSALVPIFIARQPSGKNRVYIEPEIPLPASEDLEADLQAGAARSNQVIERFVRRFPDQWVWFHQRWKSRQPEA